MSTNNVGKLPNLKKIFPDDYDFKMISFVLPYKLFLMIKRI